MRLWPVTKFAADRSSTDLPASTKLQHDWTRAPVNLLVKPRILYSSPTRAFADLGWGLVVRGQQRADGLRGLPHCHHARTMSVCSRSGVPSWPRRFPPRAGDSELPDAERDSEWAAIFTGGTAKALTTAGQAERALAQARQTGRVPRDQIDAARPCTATCPHPDAGYLAHPCGRARMRR